VFQTRAAATGRARSPTVDRRVRLTISDEDEVERSHQRPPTDRVRRRGMTVQTREDIYTFKHFFLMLLFLAISMFFVFCLFSCGP